MRILSWNVRGMGNDRTFLALKTILQMHNPQVVFLCETKLMSVQMRKVGKLLKFDGCFAISSKGRSEGITMMWNSEISVNITSFSSHHIDAEVQTERRKWVRCTEIYGHPEADQKRHTWNLLRRLAGLSSTTWLCFGDFNEILHLHEKNGGNDRNSNAVSEFRKAIQDSKLIDMGSNGCSYTWSNRRFGSSFIEEKLDRFFYSKDWTDHFHDAMATNLVSWSSDHNPILMEVRERSNKVNYKRKFFQEPITKICGVLTKPARKLSKRNGLVTATGWGIRWCKRLQKLQETL